MYFTLFGYNSVLQGISMVQDLKFGQYAKLPPRAIFSAQVTGTLIGAVVNYIMMMASPLTNGISYSPSRAPTSGRAKTSSSSPHRLSYGGF